MFHSRQLNNKINNVQERALRITYKDTESSYSELLEKDCANAVLSKNLQLLMTEKYKIKNNLRLSLKQEIPCNNESYYNLRNNNEFLQPRVRSVNYGTESIRLRGPQLWQMLPQSILCNLGSLHQFKANINTWKGEVSMQTMLDFYTTPRIFILPIFETNLYLIYNYFIDLFLLT